MHRFNIACAPKTYRITVMEQTVEVTEDDFEKMDHGDSLIDICSEVPGKGEPFYVDPSKITTSGAWSFLVPRGRHSPGTVAAPGVRPVGSGNRNGLA